MRVGRSPPARAAGLAITAGLALVAGLVAGLAPALAHAHTGPPPGGSLADAAPLWLARGVYAVAWLAYVAGAVRQRPPWPRQGAFHAAMLVAGLALFGPLDDLAQTSTALHMVQHMLLLVVVAPLAVLARPLAQWRAVAGRATDRGWRAVLRLGRQPMACALLQAAAIWLWHVPVFYMAAVEHTGWHVLEHACFLFGGWLFWWSVLRPGRSGAPQAALALLFTVMHTGLLGALLTFARAPLYGGESRELADQQLAGLVMWIPAGTFYLLATAWAGYRWLAGPLQDGSPGAAMHRASALRQGPVASAHDAPGL